MPPLRVVSLLDAAAVTGPAKNLIQFCRAANAFEGGDFAIRISIATVCRGPHAVASPFIEAARAAGIEVDVLVERYRYDPRTIGQLKEVLKHRGAGIIETHGVRMHFLARISGLGAKIPWVAFHHGYTAEDLKMLAYNQLDRWSLRKAACVFTDCRPFADELAELGIRRERIRVLGSSIAIGDPPNPHKIRALSDQLGIEPGETVILSIGRLSREKAQTDLIAAVASLLRISPQRRLRLVLVGDGPDRKRLREAAAAAGLSHMIVFAGHQNDVRPWYGIAQLFVLSSMSEGSPNVLLEAMSAGVPIVSTAVGGVPEMLEHGWSGLLVPPGNHDALAQQMERLIGDPGLAARLTRNAALDLRERFSPDAYRGAVTEAYAHLMADAL